LGGYWDDYPTLKNSFVALNVIQVVLAANLFTFILYYAFQKRLLERDWTIKLLPDRFTLSLHVIIPLIICTWEMLLAGMQLSFVYAWYSAPSMSMVYLHSQIEWWLVVVRIAMLFHSERGCCDHRGLQVLTMVSFFFTASTLLAFTTTSNPQIQGILAGIAFFTDFSLFFVAPISLCKSWDKKEIFGSKNAILGEILVTVLYFVHIIQYYPPLFMGFSPDPHMKQVAGTWLIVSGWVNLAVYVAYMIYAFLGLQSAVRIQKEEVQRLLND